MLFRSYGSTSILLWLKQSLHDVVSCDSHIMCNDAKNFVIMLPRVLEIVEHEVMSDESQKQYVRNLWRQDAFLMSSLADETHDLLENALIKAKKHFTKCLRQMSTGKVMNFVSGCIGMDNVVDELVAIARLMQQSFCDVITSQSLQVVVEKLTFFVNKEQRAFACGQKSGRRFGDHSIFTRAACTTSHICFALHSHWACLRHLDDVPLELKHKLVSVLSAILEQPHPKLTSSQELSIDYLLEASINILMIDRSEIGRASCRERV